MIDIRKKVRKNEKNGCKIKEITRKSGRRGRGKNTIKISRGRRKKQRRRRKGDKNKKNQRRPSPQ